jgi:PTH2 family peptidyl-tRNA hydrolase
MFKQVIIVRKDVGMEKGKLAAQVAHASLGAYKKAGESDRDEWEAEGSKKVVLKVDSLKEIIEIYDKVRKRLPCSLVRDAGKTQVSSGTVTALGIGPCREEDVDKITKHLKLL